MRAFAFVTLCAFLAACGRGTPIPSARESGELVVATRNGPTAYYENAQGDYVGFEHDLAALFANELGLSLRFVVINKFDDILPAVKNRQVHFAAAGLTITEERKRSVSFSTAYQTVQQQLIYRINAPQPRSLAEVVGKRLSVVAGSSYAERLRQARRALPKLQWAEVSDRSAEDLLAQVADGEIDYTIADSNAVEISQNFYPSLGVAFSFGRAEYLAWAFPKDGDAWLYKKSIEFFARIQKNGTLKRLLDRYYGHIERLDYPDIVGFLARTRSVLPKYRALFQEAQEQTGVDWRLLAALGYQESQWDPLATSPTGVRGLMMLTAQTADSLGVADRLDARESILAGAKYFVRTKDMIPLRIPEPDRTWMTMAAYNVGYGHLEDARVLAARQGLNADSWTDLKKTLPQLSKAQYHSTVKHGYARGGEPVIFTENIRTYYDILLKFEKPYKPPFAPFGKTAKNGASTISRR